MSQSRNSRYVYDYPHLGQPWSNPPHMTPNYHGIPEAKSIFKLTMEEAATIFAFFVCDVAWSFIGFMTWNLKFQKSESFLETSLAQLAYTSVFTYSTIFLTASVIHKYYKCSYQKALAYSAIAAFSEIYTILAWDGVAAINPSFFESLGYNKTTSSYLGSLFPGPGVAAGPLQTIAIAATTLLYDKKYKLDLISFLIGISPVSFITGNGWALLFTLFSSLGVKSFGKAIGASLALATGLSALNYITFVITNALTHGIKKGLHIFTHSPHLHFTAPGKPKEDVLRVTLPKPPRPKRRNS